MRIRYVDFYDEAPKNAKYILRGIIGCGCWKLEKYFVNEYEVLDVETLQEFPVKPEHPMKLKEQFPEMEKSTLWVER